MIGPEDDKLHEIGPEKFYQESYYFNWSVPDADAFGLARIGYRFNQGRVDSLLLTIRDGLPEFCYPGVNLRPDRPFAEQVGATEVGAGRLRFIMDEPAKKWRIKLNGRSHCELAWEALSPVFDYHAEERDFIPDVAANHLEQVGRVTGRAVFKGRELEIDCLGHRDKSWGVRDWARIQGWNWVSAQFGPDLAFNAWEGFHGGERMINGFIFRDGENSAWKKVQVMLEGEPHFPSVVRLLLVDAAGRSYEVTAESLGQFPLVKSGLWLQEIFARFTLRSGDIHRVGYGVIEHAWHAGVGGTLAGLPRLMRDATEVLF